MHYANLKKPTSRLRENLIRIQNLPIFTCLFLLESDTQLVHQGLSEPLIPCCQASQGLWSNIITV